MKEIALSLELLVDEQVVGVATYLRVSVTEVPRSGDVVVGEVLPPIAGKRPRVAFVEIPLSTSPASDTEVARVVVQRELAEFPPEVEVILSRELHEKGWSYASASRS